MFLFLDTIFIFRAKLLQILQLKGMFCLFLDMIDLWSMIKMSLIVNCFCFLTIKTYLNWMIIFISDMLILYLWVTDINFRAIVSWNMMVCHYLMRGDRGHNFQMFSPAKAVMLAYIWYPKKTIKHEVKSYFIMSGGKYLNMRTKQ